MCKPKLFASFTQKNMVHTLKKHLRRPISFLLGYRLAPHIPPLLLHTTLAHVSPRAIVAIIQNTHYNYKPSPTPQLFPINSKKS